VNPEALHAGYDSRSPDAGDASGAGSKQHIVDNKKRTISSAVRYAGFGACLPPMTKHPCTTTQTQPPAKPGRTHKVAPLLPRARAPTSSLGVHRPYATAFSDDAYDRDALPRLLSTAEVAAIFRRSKRTIRNWTQRGYLRPVRVGRSLFFRKDDVRALVADRLCRGTLAISLPSLPGRSG
jgi:excisionase family DNA binding protein